MIVRWKSNLKIFLTLDIVELKSFLTLISAQQHPFSLLQKFKMNHKEVLYISSRKCENIWIKSLDIKVSLYSEARVLHWEINPPHLWARLTPPLRRTNGLASLVSSILDSYHPSPELMLPPLQCLNIWQDSLPSLVLGCANKVIRQTP